jgi:hypothetical protein
MPMVDSANIERAVAVQIAGEIVKGMDGAQREAVLQRAMAEALSSYSLKDAVERAVAEKAEQVARQLIDGEAWGRRIADRVRLGVELYLEQLPTATALAVREALHGKSGKGSYSTSCGIVLKRIQFPGEAE